MEAGPGCKRAPRLMLGATLASIFLSLLACPTGRGQREVHPQLPLVTQTTRPQGLVSQ